MAEKKAKKDDEKKTHRAYSRYAQDPVFVGMAVLALLLAMTTFYFASDSHCPTGAAVVADDLPADTDGGDVVVDVDDDDDVVEDSPAADSGGKIQIYEFSEFKCPFCAAADGFNDDLVEQFKSQDPSYESAVPKIKEVYGDDVEVVFKHFIVHESARKASEAAECARDQGKFWEMHDIMFENMANLEADDLKDYAEQISLDTDEFDQCLDGGEKSSIVEADTQLGRDLGVSGTPTFFVGGEDGWKVVGAQPFSAFEEPIGKALQGEFPPKPGPEIGKFKSLLLPDGVCTEDGKPVVMMFGTTGCPFCTWSTPQFDKVAKEYMDEGKIMAYHWQFDTGDNTLTEEVETEVPESATELFRQFNSGGGVPTFVFGCKYYRIGQPYRASDDAESDEAELRAVIDAIIEEEAA